MSEYLLELAAMKAEDIRKKIDEASFREIAEYIRGEWVDYTPGEVEVGSYGAVDGSNNSIEFKGLTLYALVGYSIAKYGDEVREYMVGDIDILYPPGTGERIRLLREIAEAKAALIPPKLDLLLIDGSIRSLLIHPRPLAREIGFKKALEKATELFGEGVFSELYNRIREQINSYGKGRANKEPFISKEIVLRYNLTLEDNEAIVVLLEYIEKLLSIRLLIERYSSTTRSPELVYLSKTSRSQLYTKRFKDEIKKGIPIPSDMTAFSYFTTTPGYSKPILQSEIEDLKRFPNEGELRSLIREFYDNVDFIISYIRLEEAGPILKVEIPIVGETPGADSMCKAVEKVMDMLKPTSINGYPYPLIEVDKVAKIKRSDITLVLQVLGILPRLTGREVLEEWIYGSL